MRFIISFLIGLSSFLAMGLLWIIINFFFPLGLFPWAIFLGMSIGQFIGEFIFFEKDYTKY